MADNFIVLQLPHPLGFSEILAFGVGLPGPSEYLSLILSDGRWVVP